MTDLAVVLGTRSEIVTLAPVIEAALRCEVETAVVHTGQHYSGTADAGFFDQLDLPEPACDLGVGSEPPARQTGEMLIGLESALRERSPAVVVVGGNTNTALAGSIAASKLETEVAHVEAGVRDAEGSRSEETNGVVADHVADYLFPPTADHEQYLARKGVSRFRTTVTGSPSVDAVRRHRTIARHKSAVLDELGLREGEFFLLTAHRAENVDDEARFRRLVSGAARAGAEHDRDVIYPIDPRAQDRLDAFGIEVPDRIRRVEPQAYLDFLRLEAGAALILTDAATVQEEACTLGVPCVTVRETTDRPETVAVGANRLSPCDPAAIAGRVTEMIDRSGVWANPFGDGDAAERILGALPVDSRVGDVTPWKRTASRAQDARE